MAFRRINFFKGFFTRAEDWQAAEAYHIDKRNLHNTTLHTPGIVQGLEVKASTNGLAVSVSPGVAIDDDGREIILDQPAESSIPFDSGKDTVHIVIQHDDQKVDFRQDAANTDYSDYAFIEERAKVTTVTDLPKDKATVVLAKIKLAAGAQRILDANQRDKPQDNEIDLGVRKRAGSMVSSVALAQMADRSLAGTVRLATGPDEQQIRSWTVDTEGHVFHVASVYPVAGYNAQISWRMGAFRKDNLLEYALFVRNHSPLEIQVAYRVVQLR